MEKYQCIVSHRVMLEDGKFRDYKAGEIYELPEDHDLGGNFVPVDEAPKNEMPRKEKAKGGK